VKLLYYIISSKVNLDPNLYSEINLFDPVKLMPALDLGTGPSIYQCNASWNVAKSDYGAERASIHCGRRFDTNGDSMYSVKEVKVTVGHPMGSEDVGFAALWVAGQSSELYFHIDALK
jgi:hypothetical protein